MRTSRLFVTAALNPNQTLTLDDDSSHYLRTVLRLKKDDAITLFNGNGLEYASHIDLVSRQCVLIRIGASTARTVESPLQIHLGLSIARGDRMDFAVQKAVELGVNKITPIITERTVVQLSGDKPAQRLKHWQKIIQHAVEQSGRTVLPELANITPIATWLTQQAGLKIFLDPGAEQRLTQLKPDNALVTLLTGPEGGFAQHERDLAKQAGFIPIRLGQRILRTETASLTALAAVQMLWGDFA